MRDVLQALLRVPHIDPIEEANLPPTPPLISVIVPAHNEEAKLRACLQSVIEQDYPRFELIVVDDRSTDDTAAIAASVVRGLENCKIVSVDHLRPGWTGKCHALDVGVRHATGEWLAFLDADSRLHRSALRQCYHHATRSHVNMITLSPKFIMNSFWEKALQPSFAAMSCILFPLDKVNDPDSSVASANGMFYLITRHAYEKIGGHHDVRELAVEDIGIGKRVKAAGLGLIFANGRHILQTRMYTSFREILRGWTRILSAAMNYELPTVLRFLGMHLLMSFPVLLASMYFYVCGAPSVWPGGWFLLPAVCLGVMCLVPALFYSQLGTAHRYTVLLILGNLMLIWVFLVIVKKILFKDALQWRGTTYHGSRYQPTRLEPGTSHAYPARSPVFE
ncbi:MAG: glycosyltransferase [Desulfomonile tiedjei]|nr:glycosyltransferase [Desulfomonile tiedjei]